MIVKHLCCECGFNGGLHVVDGQVKCPNCKTINDVWLDEEETPKRHRELSIKGGDTMYICDICKTKYDNMDKAIECCMDKLEEEGEE